MAHAGQLQQNVILPFYKNRVIVRRHQGAVYHRCYVSFFRLFPVVPAFLLLAACNSQHVLVKKSDLVAAEQCLSLQQQREAQWLQQQQLWQQTLSALNETLSKPLSVNTPAPVIKPDVVQPAECSNSAEVTTAKAPRSTGKQRVGQVEKAWLPHLDMILTARMDTGATTASLDARDIQVFERDGEQWVRFTVIDGEKPRTFERKRVRKVRIIQSSTEEAERRPVIELQVVIGSISQKAEFTLTDRSHLDYQVLIGRNILRDVMVVDVSESHIAPLNMQDKP